MKETLSTHEVANRLVNDEIAAWTYNGAMALAEYLEELEYDMGEEMELDVVALRCEFSEYESLMTWAEDHLGNFKNVANELDLTVDMSGDEFEEDEDDVEEAIRDYIQERGSLIEFDTGIIVSCF